MRREICLPARMSITENKCLSRKPGSRKPIHEQTHVTTITVSVAGARGSFMGDSTWAISNYPGSIAGASHGARVCDPQQPGESNCSKPENLNAFCVAAAHRAALQSARLAADQGHEPTRLSPPDSPIFPYDSALLASGDAGHLDGRKQAPP